MPGENDEPANVCLSLYVSRGTGGGYVNKTGQESCDFERNLDTIARIIVSIGEMADRTAVEAVDIICSLSRHTLFNWNAESELPLRSR